MANYQPPKGMRDFTGSQMLMRQDMMQKIESVYKAWGYQPLSTPAMEYQETLGAKAGAEIAGQLFKIEDSTLALRFDLTVPLARFAANTSLPKPYKRYCVAPVWRREEPQKGRMREFLQADADIIGSSSMRSEAELLAMASEALIALGIPNFTIKLNNRKILAGVVQKLGIANQTAVFRAIDKLEKAGLEGVEAELKAAGMGASAISRLLETLSPDFASNSEALDAAAEYSKEGADELGQILSLLENSYGIKDVKIDLSLVRGLDYYTGPIFEISAGGGIGSVSGGGRYDNLLGTYGQASPAVGISLGIERLFALKQNEEGAAASPSMAIIINLDDDCYSAAISLARTLRKSKISVQTDLNSRNMRKQLDFASSLSIPFAIIIGKKEIESGQYVLKDLSSGEQAACSAEELVRRLSK